MELTITALILFIGVVGTWFRLPGSISAIEEEPQVTTPELAPQMS
jgi:hypothetical protein